MKTFAELLSEHLRRVGVSDAELARTLGVRRQTIFRWREGLTQRPRERGDVLRIAAKLRLTPTERDEMLLAAGFHPEVRPEVAEDQGRGGTEDQEVGRSEGQGIGGTPQPVHRAAIWPWLMAGATVIVLVVVLLLGSVVDLPDLTGLLPGRGSRAVQSAAPGETLILVGQFANYSGGQLGYNVAGRLQDALEQEVADLGLASTRVDVLPDVIGSQEQALAEASVLDATLVIWGEYDSGRVVAAVEAPEATGDTTGRALQRLVASPAELNVTINSDLPEELRWMALYALGEAHFNAGRYPQAEAILQRTLADPPQDSAALGGIYHDLAYIESVKPSPDLSQVIAYYTLAIDRVSGFVSALNNRGVAYLQRAAEGDLARAVDDLRRTTELKPEWATGHLNLGLALLAQGSAHDAEGLETLVRAQALEPDAPGPNNALCWHYSLRERAEEALFFCDRAVERDPTGLSRDSRGVAYAMLGRYDEAITEFGAYLDWLAAQPDADQEQHRSSRETWIADLREGRSPFDEATRQALLGGD